MTKKSRFLLYVFLNLIMFWVVMPVGITVTPLTERIGDIEFFIHEQMRLGKIPGLMLVIVCENDTLLQGFGYADLRKKTSVTEETYFELGSLSKAFTGLGILKLEEEGLINLDDNIQKYLPWLTTKYLPEVEDPTINYLNQNRLIRRYLPWLQPREEATIVVRDLLRHTSGIPEDTITLIPSRNDERALEETIRLLIGQELNNRPGIRYEYATINYDILGLIIQELTGISYEEYMLQKILQPLGLNEMSIVGQEFPRELMAIGYKMGFGRPLRYHAPEYRGNTPAGYMVSNGKGLARWLKLQLGLEQSEYEGLISRSQQDDYYYSYGWLGIRTERHQRLWHSGTNPNYSAHIELQPTRKIGVGILCNLNSNYSSIIGEGVMTLLTGSGRMPEASLDLYHEIDKINIFLILGSVFLIFITINALRSRFDNVRRYTGVTRKNKKKIVSKTFVFIIFLIIIYFTPNLIFGFPWSFVLVWGPVSFPAAMGLILIEGAICYWYQIDCQLYKLKKSRRQPDFSWRELLK